MTHTLFQRRVWALAQEAHSAADRADARILLQMVEVVDRGDYDALGQLVQALRAPYRDRLGEVPAGPDQDPSDPSGRSDQSGA